jgi:hypothetical protein
MASSIAAALAKEAFTPYAEIGDVADDGLARDEDATSLGAACMSDAGYPNVAYPFGSVKAGDPLRGTTAFGAFGFVGTTDAAQNGFQPRGGGPVPSASLSTAEQDAANTCGIIVQNFIGGQQNSTLAVVQVLGGVIQGDEARDPSIASATKAWAACVRAAGYRFSTPTLLSNDALNVFRAAQRAAQGGAGTLNGPPTLTAAQKAAQVAEAEADAACTQSADLAGIFFAVQASYEQQIVNANQQQLSKAVQQYRAAYQKELASLPSLLTTTSTTAPSPGGHR